MGLIFTVLIVWFLHRFIMEMLLRADGWNGVVVKMCSQGQCPNFARSKKQDGNAVFCKNCVRLPSGNTRVQHGFVPSTSLKNSFDKLGIADKLRHIWAVTFKTRAARVAASTVFVLYCGVALATIFSGVVPVVQRRFSLSGVSAPVLVGFLTLGGVRA